MRRYPSSARVRSAAGARGVSLSLTPTRTPTPSTVDQRRSESVPVHALDRWASTAVLAGAGVLAAFGLAGVWLFAWLEALSLVAFLVGPGLNRLVSVDEGPLPVLLLPPLLGFVGTVIWLVRQRYVLDAGRARLLRLEDDSPDLSQAPVPTWRWTLGLLAAGLLAVAAYARLVFLYHRIHGASDEGLYLYAGRLAMAGQIPYRDFYFDQAPLVPYAFGLFLAPFHFDESAARLFAIGCMLATLMATFAAGNRLGGRLAGLVAFALLATNLDFLPEVSAGLQSNGGLTTLVAALAVLALAYDRLTLALLLAAGAAGLRQVFVPLPLVFIVYVTFARRRPVLALLAGVLPLLAVYGGALVVGGQTALFGLLPPLRGPHVVRVSGPFGVHVTLADARDNAIRVFTAYLPFWLLTVPTLYLTLRNGHRHARLLIALAWASLLILLLNVLPDPDNARYPVTQLPLLAILAGVGVASVAHRLSAGQPAPAVTAAVAMLLAAAPFLAVRPSSFVDQYQSRPPLATFLNAANYVRGLTGGNGTLVTLETPFATQTGMRLAHGLEVGSWGIYRDISTDQARRMGVLTYDMLIDMLDQAVGDVVIESDRYGFKNFASNDEQRARTQQALDQHYELKQTFQDVSDWGNVRVWVRRGP